MLIVKEEESGMLRAGEIQDLFPNTSFPESGPNLSWYTENKCYQVNLLVDYDPETEILINVLPYVVDGWAYITKAIPKPADTNQ